jgi:hypothetical protein
MSSDLKIEKISNKEVRILLGEHDQVTKATVTAEDLYEQLGKYLESQKAGVTPKGCVIDYA